MKIFINHDNEDLWCCFSKERIEKYAEIEEDYLGEIIYKTYKLEYAPSENELEDEEPWISDDNFPENGDLG